MEPKRPPFQPPSRVSVAVPTRDCPLNMPGEDLNANKPAHQQIYVPSNVRTSAPAASPIPTVPIATGTYAFLDTSDQRAKIAMFYSFKRFFLYPIDVLTYEVKELLRFFCHFGLKTFFFPGFRPSWSP